MNLREVALSPVPPTVKWAFTTRRVARDDVISLDANVQYATSGDLALCRILEINQHKKIQLASQRYSLSYPGDLLVVCVGDRYAPDQFEGYAEVDPEGADLLASGGVIGSMRAAHGRMSKPTRVKPLGLLKDSAGEVINVARYGLPPMQIPEQVTVLGVVGASMNAGKTTAAVSLAHGLSRAGYRVAGVKVTGTGAFGDFNAFEDAGVPALDFTDAGMASTYRMPNRRIEQGFETLVGTAASRGAEVVVVEVADGVFQKETASLLAGSALSDRLDGILFAAPDALSVVGGVEVLQRYGHRPFAISGMVTCSPLAGQEALEATGIPLVSRKQLCCPDGAAKLVGPLLRHAASIEAKTAA